MSTQTIKVPDIGGAEGVEVIEICVAVGDQVAAEDSLVVLESDKASMEVPSPMAGTVTAIRIADGDSLSEGDIILELETDAAANEESSVAESPSAAPEASEAVSAEPAATASPTPAEQKAPQPTPAAPAESTIEAIRIPDLGGGG